MKTFIMLGGLCGALCSGVCAQVARPADAGSKGVGQTLMDDRKKPGTTPSVMREWTSVNGNVLEGAFLREEQGKVYLKRPDGSIVATTREKLSPNDLKWMDDLSGAREVKTAKDGVAPKTQSFIQATSSEKTKMPVYLGIKRLFIKSYAELTNNQRADKSLAFLLRDASQIYGWASITADCYPLPNGQKGKVKEMTFFPPQPVELREAVQMTRDKFMIAIPDPVVLKSIDEQGAACWEIQNPPSYVSRIVLRVDPETRKIRQFVIFFPAP